MKFIKRVAISNSVKVRKFSTNQTKLDRFVTKEQNEISNNQSLLSYAIAQALKNLMPKRLDDEYLVEWNTILGEGRFGTVRACTNIKTGLEAVVKTQSKSQCKRDPDTGQFYEVEAMNSLVNGYLLYSVFETPLKLHIVSERLQGQNLFAYLDEKGWKKTRNEREEREAAKLIEKFIRATIVAHNAGFAHLDVKFENFMFREKNRGENDLPVLIDYGSARPLHGNKNVGVIGTLSYTAPEIILKGVFSEKSDAWSLGVMAFTILQGYFPISRIEYVISDYDVYYCPIEWRKISAEGQDFVRQLLKIDPEERISLKEVLEHPWINQEARILLNLRKASSDQVVAADVLKGIELKSDS